MSSIITRGYLIHRENYGVFDEIITFINEHNLKFTCFCYGVKKINSKNARNLDYGDFIEFEFFYSKNKLSKLKKANIINTLNWENKKKLSLAIINEYFYYYEFKHDYDFYQSCILYINMNINDYLLIIYILIYLIKTNGLKIAYETCYECGDINNELWIDLEKGISYCQQCKKNNYKLNQIYHQILINFFKNDVDLLLIDKFNVSELKLIIKKLSKFLYNGTGIYISSIKGI